MAVPEQHSHAVFCRIVDIALIRNYYEVRISILIDVAHEHLPRLGTGCKGGTLCFSESTPSISEQNRHRAVVEVCRNDVGMSIVIEVCGAQSFIWPVANRKEMTWQAKSALAVA